MKLGLRLTTAALLAVAVLVPFALLAVLVVGGWAPLHDGDAAITDALHSWALAHRGWRDAAVWWTNIFGPTPLRAATLGLVVWLLVRRARRLALWVVVTMVTGGVLGAVLKLLVGRHRPDLLDPVARATGYSFPSGHALNAALAAGVFVLVLPVVRRRWVLWTGAAVVAFLTGLTRIVLGVHWTSDVVGGWLLGVMVVAATAVAFTRRGLDSVVEQGVEPAVADAPAAETR
ncbi:phosphatase PAP2 family protein [Couchioplanes caeruleus]|uniref:phosphatase PAP2 family protein n=1 Tax=Couchioplanes caeruleus TaxID=56438 RepID=UPI0020C14479|nr:phosphatase PAP2 family protein [Couchioplanes caeruleus]UQU62893.1 phosphatase PAP2 family protein [Couchioplanes caeruleus]